MAKAVSIKPRKLARQMAKAQLERSHITGYNKERIGVDGKKIPSLFARKWKELAIQAASIMPQKKKQGRK